MACHEMRVIKELDVPLLRRHQHLLHFYFAEQDDWVGKYRAEILKSFQPDVGSVKVVGGHKDIPHAFCISEYNTIVLNRLNAEMNPKTTEGRLHCNAISG